MSTVDPAKWDEKIVHCLFRELGPVEYEHNSGFVLPKEFDELSYPETMRFLEEFF